MYSASYAMVVAKLNHPLHLVKETGRDTPINHPNAALV